MENSNKPKRGRKPLPGTNWNGQITGLNDGAIAHLKSTNASKYIRELIHTDLANKLSK
jgi:hypothetical protein